VTMIVRRSWVIPALGVAAALMLVTAGATAAVETDTVATFGRGLWWSLALMTTVGFIGDPPQTTVGAAISGVLMVSGFLLLALISAALASLFVQEDEQEVEKREAAENRVLLEELHSLRQQVERIQAHLEAPGAGRARGPADSPDSAAARPSHASAPQDDGEEPRVRQDGPA
jgi:voltage-gated potassium channel